MDRLLGVLMAISMNRGEARRSDPARRGLPIDSPVSGFTQSTHPAYAAGSRLSSAVTAPELSSVANCATVASAPR